MRTKNKVLYEKIMSSINNALNEALDDHEQIKWINKIEKQWEKLHQDIQNAYDQFGRPLSHELKWNIREQWLLLIKQAVLIRYDNVDLIREDLETFMDENDYKKNWCVVLLGNGKKIDYNAKLNWRDSTYDSWPKDHGRQCQIISEYLTEDEATAQADQLNKTLSKTDKLINRMKYIVVKMHQVEK